MKSYRFFIFAAAVLLIAAVAGREFVKAEGKGKAANQERSVEKAKEATGQLAMLWTSGDADVANNVCFMYTHEAKRKGWFRKVMLIVWGPSAKLLSEDKKLQEKVKEMMADGVDVKACIVCARRYGVVEDLRELGIEVKGMGRPLTRLLKSDWKMLTF